MLKAYLKFFINSSLFIFGSLVILLETYLFGWDFLSSNLVGNDIGMAYTAATWVDKFFPFIPEWFPLHGAGVSLTQGNQIGAPFLTVLTLRILPLNLAQSMHLWEFLSIYLTAIGIMLFTRVKFKSWVAAILAGIFYPLSHAAWPWISEIGLYANAVAFIFYAPAILCLDLFLEEYFSAKRQRRETSWFILTVFFTAAALFIHFTIGTVLLETIFVYGFIYSLMKTGKKIRTLFSSTVLLFLIIISSLLLAGFIFFPFLRYVNIASRNLLPVWSFEQIPYIPLDALFGFSNYYSLSVNNAMWYVFFCRPVWILGLVGIIMAILKKNYTAISLSIVFLFFVFYAVAPGITPWLVKALIIFWRDIYIRSLTPAIIFLPVLAAWGCLSLAQLSKKIIPRIDISPVLAILLAASALFIFKGAPANLKEQQICYEGFGRWWRSDIDYCKFWDKLNHLDFRLSSKAIAIDQGAINILNNLNLLPQDRIDITPKHGRIAENWSITSDIPILTLYWYALSLNNIFWGYQGGVYYDNTNVEPDQVIPELASWFGLKSVILNKTSDEITVGDKFADPVWKYKSYDWEDVYDDPTSNIIVKNFIRPQGLVTLTSRPTVLVIGQKKLQAYEQIFRRATGGALSYNKAFLVEGRDDGRIDKYTLDELNKFDAVILYSQIYDDKDKVDKLLSDYIKGGGRLFIESGWQYSNTEWQTLKPLSVIPLRTLKWDMGPTTSLNLNNSVINSNFDPHNFQAFTYYGSSWDVSTSSREDVLDWGQIVLERNNMPIIVVGNLGQGRVVWSGMNLIGHLNANLYREEWNFTQKLFDWLLEGKSEQNFAVSYARNNPDKVEFIMGESTSIPTYLLWRENYYPDWKATTQGGQNIPIYRVGPNLILMRLPPLNYGSKITLEFQISLISLISRIISLGTFILLFLILIFPAILTFLTRISKKGFSVFSKSILEDNEQ
ncbi:MAG: hypothetical protein V1858_04275 [Candidatus Gottesmanbacteria bacterium]